MLACCHRSLLLRVPHPQVLFHHGTLRMYKNEAELDAGEKGGLAIVTSGLLRVTYTDPDGHIQEFFLASGAN